MNWPRQLFSGSDEGIKNELGDLMLHIVFYAKIGSEKGVFHNGRCS